MDPAINIQRLRANIEALGRFGLEEGGGITRAPFSPADRQAGTWLLEAIRAAGLAGKTDEAGNIFGRLGPEGPAVLAGSHMDTVPHGGKFDGALGILAALECLQTARERNLSPGCPLEMVAFADEEGTYYGFLGSRALTGVLNFRELERAQNPEGTNLRHAMAAAGLEMGVLNNACRDPKEILAYLELHIEQGPRLADARLPIGIVRSITGLIWYWVSFEGESNHAGTTPLDRRRDAFLGTADFCLQVNDYVRESGQGVVTFGDIRLKPGAFNVVSGSARLAMEFRAAAADQLEAMEKKILSIGQQVARQRDLSFTAQQEFYDPPVRLSDKIQDLLKQEAERLGYAYRLMDSMAAHDAQVMAEKTEAGMIFIPSLDGRSHCPQESSSWEDIAKGTQLLMNSLLRLATQQRSSHD